MAENDVKTVAEALAEVRRLAVRGARVAGFVQRDQDDDAALFEWFKHLFEWLRERKDPRFQMIFDQLLLASSEFLDELANLPEAPTEKVH